MKRLIIIILLGFCVIGSAEFDENTIVDIFSDPFLSESDIYEQISRFNDYSEENKTGEIIKQFHSDEAPWYYYLPSGYDSEQSTKLLVWLHGGVGREEWIDDESYVREHPFIEYCEREKIILLFAMARSDCQWWQPAGEEHIIESILYLKQHYNIDDDRIYLSGFSDGGSGSYHFAYRKPEIFAAFYPLNGMISVASGETGLPCYLPNLANRPLRAVNTDEDRLYPSAQTRKTLELAQAAGGNITYREYNGFGHDWGYFDLDMPLIFADISRQARNSFAGRIYWESSINSNYNRIDWLEITGIDTLLARKEWQQEYNVSLADERITIGFFDDREYKGEGILVERVLEGTLAEEMQLHKGDIIIEMDGNALADIEDLSAAKSRKKRGDQISLKVYRSEKEQLLKGSIPPPVYYDAFEYKQPSGAVKAQYLANTFMIETSGVSSLCLYISPEMINPEIPVQVIINGQQYFEEKVGYDKNIMQESLLRSYDRKCIWINKIELKLTE